MTKDRFGKGNRGKGGGGKGGAKAARAPSRSASKGAGEAKRDYGEKKRDSKFKGKAGGEKKSFGADKPKRDFKAGDKNKTTLGKRVQKGGKFDVVKQDAPKQGQPVLNRRQKQKVSDLIKSLRINYNKLMMKKKEVSN